MKKISKNKSRDKKTAKKIFIYLAFLMIVPLILYFKVINYGFTGFDDTLLISANYNKINNLDNIPKAFTTDAFFTNKTGFYRPLQTVSFMFDAQVNGEKAGAYHFSNLLLHLLIIASVFFLLIKVGFSNEISFLLALLYAVHPLLTNAVCWIPARGDLLLTFTGLLTFITFIFYYERKKTIFLITHSFIFLLACFSKETAVVFPVLLMLYFYFIIKKDRSWKEILPFCYVWTGSFMLYFLLRNSAVAGGDNSSNSGLHAFIKNLPAFPITFGKFFIPQDLSTLPLFNSLSVIIGILSWIALVIIIIKYKIYTNPLLIIGVAWFVGFTLPPLYYRLSHANIMAEYFEHRTGLPVIGLLFIIGIFLNTLSIKSFSGILKVYIPVLILFSYLSYNHSNDYADSMSFANAAISSNPDNAFGYNLRGISSKNLRLSLADFESAIKISPSFSDAWFNEGILFHSQNEDNKAEYSYAQAFKYDTLAHESSTLHQNIILNYGGEEIFLKKFNEAISILSKGTSDIKNNADIYSNLGYAYLKTAKYDSAIYAYSKGIEIQPNNSVCLVSRGQAKFFVKDYYGALADLNKTKELNPEFADSWLYSGKSKIEINDLEGALSDLTHTIDMMPKLGEAYFYRGIVYSKMQKTAESEKDLQEAKNLGFKQ